MPELPEVETVRRGLRNHLEDRRLDAVELRRDDLRWPIPVDDVRALKGRTCQRIERRSKYVLMHFDGWPERTAMIHLGMSGRVFVEEDEGQEYEQHEHWRMRFGDWLVRYIDPRRFGMLDVTDTSALGEHPLIVSLGPEPLTDAFDGEYLFAATRRRKQATKVFLMDAHVVVGVGNIYASEACFRAGVRPRRAAGRLSRADCDALVASIKEVLNEAIDAGGTTLRDYRGVARDAGYFARRLFVYGRDGEPCHVCGTEIRRVVTGQRSTFYCPTCQT